MIKSFFSDSAVYTIPVLFSRGLSFFLLPFYTHVLSPSDYGALDMLLIFGSIVNLTIALEVSQGLARFYTDEKDTENKKIFFSTALWFVLFCYTTFLIISFFLTKHISLLIMGASGFENIYQMGIIYIFQNGILYLLQNQLRWELRSKTYSITSLLVSFSTAAIALSLTYILKWGLAGIILGMIGGAFIGSIYGIWHLRTSICFNFDIVRLKQMLRFSIPLVPSSVTVFISSYVDRMMLSHYMSLQEVGLYGIGFRLASIVSLVMTSVQNALTPLVYNNYKKPETPCELATIFRIFIMFSFFIILALSLFSKNLISLLTTPAFYSAEGIVVFLAPAILLSQMYIFTPGIGIKKKTHLFIWINAFGALLCIFLNWCFIPEFGILGAAVSKLLGYGVIFCIYMIFSQRLYKIPHNWYRLIGAFIFTTILIYFANAIKDLSMINLIMKGLMFVPLFTIFILFGLIKREELVKVYHILLPGRIHN